ncbi:hypothetical protein [Candidatus Sordicultor fermentans]|uniref:hypothetical protein n=1 Tax=Candidatus Sordicultor fermentans TaxID=1953203 RepID=UPI0016BA4B88|nr:hypothetical protein [Candidatus Atribacteria bacterium]
MKNTITIEELAKDLRMKPDELMKESLETFLKHKLRVIESELFLLAKRYGVRDVQEFDKMIQEGKFHEEDAFEDYFTFDNLEAERDLILEYLDKL